MPINYQKATLIAESIATMSSWYSEMGGNEQASYLFWNFMATPDSLSQQSRFQGIMSIHSLFLSFQNSYYLVQEGTLDVRIHKTMTETIIGVKDQSGFQLFWKTRRSLFYTEFQNYVDQILKSDKEISRGLYKNLEEGKLKNDSITNVN